MNIVVGGGWAGLAAAVELARHDRPVTLIEAGAELGGRARRVRRGDNGQHLIIGAYRELLRLLAVTGVDEAGLFERRALELRLHTLPSNDHLRLRLPHLPAPLHLIVGLATARGLSFAEKRQALRLCLALRRPPAGPDRSVAEMLRRHGQSDTLVARLWEPLCLATLNARVHEASAILFRRVLNDSFAQRRADSDLLLARGDLGAQFPDPARRFILARGGRVLTGTRVTGLVEDDGRITAVRLADGTTLKAAHVVLALPPPACERLLRPLPAMAELATRLAAIGSAPIATVYLRYPPSVSLPFPLLGLLGTTGQWVCDLAVAGKPGWMGVVISGTGAHTRMTREQLVARIGEELAALRPDWPAPIEGYALREKRATFFATVGVEALRPGSATPCPNLHLAGDATDTGYPATLEGAVRSGVAAARRIVGEDEHSPAPGASA